MKRSFALLLLVLALVLMALSVMRMYRQDGIVWPRPQEFEHPVGVR